MPRIYSPICSRSPSPHTQQLHAVSVNGQEGSDFFQIWQWVKPTKVNDVCIDKGQANCISSYRQSPSLSPVQTRSDFQYKEQQIDATLNNTKVGKYLVTQAYELISAQEGWSPSREKVLSSSPHPSSKLDARAMDTLFRHRLTAHSPQEPTMPQLTNLPEQYCAGLQQEYNFMPTLSQEHHEYSSSLTQKRLADLREEERNLLIQQYEESYNAEVTGASPYWYEDASKNFSIQVARARRSSSPTHQQREQKYWEQLEILRESLAQQLTTE